MDGIRGISHSTRRKKLNKLSTSQSRPFLQRFSFTISKNTLNKLVALCAGKQANDMFERNRLFKYFKSLPDITEASCTKCYNDQVCANAIGGSDTGEREERPSIISPWKDPNASVIYRYRNTPQSYRSALASNALTFVCPHKLKSPSISSSASLNNLSPSASPIPGNAVALVTPSSQSSPPSVAPKRPVKLKPCLKSPLTADERRFGTASTPKKINNVGFTKSCTINDSRTTSGRPVLRTNSQLGIASPPTPFPPRWQRMRFDPRTSEPENKAPDPSKQPSARLPPPLKTAPGSVMPYKVYPQYCQIWEPSVYIVKSMDPADPTLQWLRANGLSCQATLRPDTMSLVKSFDDDIGIKNMEAFLARNSGSNVNEAAVKETLMTLRSLKQPQMKLIIPRRNGRPIIIKRPIAARAPITASRRQAQMARDTNSAYERAQADKGKKAAPLMERSNTKGRNINQPAVLMKLTEDEKSRQAAGAREISGLAVVPDKKVRKTSPLKQVVTTDDGLKAHVIPAATKDKGDKRVPSAESISLITRRLSEERARSAEFSGATNVASRVQGQFGGQSPTLVEHQIPTAKSGPEVTVTGTPKRESIGLSLSRTGIAKLDEEQNDSSELFEATMNKGKESEHAKAETSDAESEESDNSWNPAWLIEEYRNEPEPQAC